MDRSNNWIQIRNAHTNNLKNIDVDVPKHSIVVFSGVSGSGKSSLLFETIYVEAQRQLIETFSSFARARLPKLSRPDVDEIKNLSTPIVIDQQPIGRTSRGNIASYIGIFNHIRKLFSEASGQDVSLFSFNADGACPKCQGRGYLSFEMSFLDTVHTRCDVCEGRRYNDFALQHKYKGLDIAQVLDLTVSQALEFFAGDKNILRLLKLLDEVGLGYLKLGQTLSSLSGGESQRLKIATELKKKGNIYIMDEPTTGLHMSDIEGFFKIVSRLVDAGNTVVIIEHNLDIIRRADWIIDLGPEGGKNGGRILFKGTPEDLRHCRTSITARYL